MNVSLAFTIYYSAPAAITQCIFHWNPVLSHVFLSISILFVFLFLFFPIVATCLVVAHMRTYWLFPSAKMIPLFGSDNDVPLASV